MSSIFSTKILILGWKYENTSLFFAFLFGYGAIIVGRHFLHTKVHQLHREALSVEVSKRSISTLVGYNVLNSLIHIVHVIFIMSNNGYFLGIAVLSHALGVYLVYHQQRADHKHPIRSLLRALKDGSAKNDIIELKNILNSQDLKRKDFLK